MAETFEYDAFLSFASSDKEIAKPVWQEMRLNGLRVFWSDATLKDKLGDSWFDAIESSLENSRHFVLLCSPNSMLSDWVKREYKAFLSHCYRSGTRRLIPVLVGDYKVSNLPLFLREFEACRLDEPHSIKKLIRLLGGLDIEELKDALIEDPNSAAESYIQRGIISLENSFFEDAINLFKTGVSLDPKNENAQLYYCNALIAGEELRVLDLKLVDIINDRLSKLIESKDPTIRSKAMLLLGIIRHDYYKRKRIVYEGVKSEQVFNTLEKHKPSENEREFLSKISVSASAKSLFNLK